MSTHINPIGTHSFTEKLEIFLFFISLVLHKAIEFPSSFVHLLCKIFSFLIELLIFEKIVLLSTPEK